MRGHKYPTEGQEKHAKQKGGKVSGDLSGVDLEGRLAKRLALVYRAKSSPDRGGREEYALSIK